MNKPACEYLERYSRIPHTIIGDTIIIHDSALQEHIDSEYAVLVEENERLNRNVGQLRSAYNDMIKEVHLLKKKIATRNNLLDHMRKQLVVSI